MTMLGINIAVGNPIYQRRGGTPAVVQAQTAAFGADTLSGAGGYQITNASGSPITNATDAGTGTATGYALSAGGIITPTSNGGLAAQDGGTIDISCDQGTATVTLSVEADVYDAASQAELVSALAAIGTAGGKTVKIRPSGFAAGDGTRLARNVTYTSRTTVTGRGATPPLIDGYLLFENTKNFTLSNLEVHEPLARSTVIGLLGACKDFIIEDCIVHGAYRDPNGDYSASGAYANVEGIASTSAASGLPKGVTVRRCEIYDVSGGVNISSDGDGGIVYQDLEIYHTYSDTMKIAVLPGAEMAGVTVERIVCHSFIGDPADADNPHIDVLQFGASSANHDLQIENVVLRQIVAWQGETTRGRGIQGLACFPGGASDEYRPIFKDIVVAGCALAIDGSQHCTFKINGGVFVNNTFVMPSPTWSPFGIARINLNDSGTGANSTGALTLSGNITEAVPDTGGCTVTSTDNLVIGARGATYSFPTVFDGASFPAESFDEVKTKFSMKAAGPADIGDGAGAIGSGYGTYGAVLSSTGWTYDAAREGASGGGDVTAPTLSSPTDTANGSTGANGSVATDEGNGTLYWVATTSSTAPSAAQVKAGQNASGTAAANSGSQAVSGAGAQTLSPAPSGLTASTAYYLHFMHEDAAGNQSTVASGDGFTTDAAAGWTPNLVDTNGTGYFTYLSTAVPNSAKATWFWRFIPQQDSSTVAIWLSGGRGYINQVADALRVVVKDSGNAILYDQTMTGLFSAGVESRVYVAVDLAVPTISIIVDGIDVTVGSLSGAGTGLIAFARPSGVLASDAGGGPVDAHMSDFYFTTGEIIAESSFHDSGAAIDLTGVGTPKVWLGGDMTATEWNAGTQKGSITLTVGSATFTDVP